MACATLRQHSVDGGIINADGTAEHVSNCGLSVGGTTLYGWFSRLASQLCDKMTRGPTGLGLPLRINLSGPFGAPSIACVRSSAPRPRQQL